MITRDVRRIAAAQLRSKPHVRFGEIRPWYRRWQRQPPTTFHRVLALHLHEARWQRSALDE